MKPSTVRLAALGALTLVAAASIWAMMRDAPDALDRAVSGILAGGIDGAVVVFGPLGQDPEVRMYGTAGAGAAKPLSGDSRFRFASLTKPVVSAAVNEMAARGTLSLDDTLPALLPDIPFSDPQFQKVTVRDLLRHTSGMDEGADVTPLFYAPEELEAKTGLVAGTQRDCTGIATMMARRLLSHAPATHSVYSNTGYCFLGLIIEARTGIDLEDALGELVPEVAAFSFDAGSVDVTHRDSVEDQGVLVLRPLVAGAAGGLIGSPSDYHGFLARPLLNGVTAHPPFDVADNSYWGLGWRVWPDLECPRRTHFGSMPGAYSVAMVDADGNGFVAFFNGRPSEDWPPFTELAQAACKVL